MSNPKILVCMPAYEPKQAHIRAAVESVLAQTFPQWELLINDDASVREDVASHAEPYLGDPRIRLRRNPKNLGIGGNWNACIRECEGRDADYFAFLFHDDVWRPAYLEKMIDALEKNPSAGFAAANHTYLKEGDVHAAPFYDELHSFVEANIKPGLHEHRSFLRWWLARGLRPNVVGEPSFVVLRRSLMKQAGPFNESMVQFLDSEYWARCLLRADWVYVPDVLGEFRVHPGGTSALNEQAGKGLFERLLTLERVVAGLSGKDKREGNAAMSRALSGMIAKFFARRKEGRAVKAGGTGSIKKFAFRHPLIVARAFGRWLTGRAEGSNQL
jgi:glycosyltransferase involved in cell wall biosynthesis